MSDYQNFVVPFDFSAHAGAALAAAKDLARRLDAKLHLLHVITPPIYAGAYGANVPPQIDMTQLREAVKRSLSEVADREGVPAGSQTHVVEGTSIAISIQEFAEQCGADLIVMGTHGRTGLAHVFLGSVAERTLRHAPCPVLTVPVGDEAGE
jgi:nucleotide-binding universal stress UspA family protein